MTGEKFLVTRRWLEEHKTENGAYTYAQIGLMKKYWEEENLPLFRSIIGKQISIEDAKAFEVGKTQFAKKTKKIMNLNNQIEKIELCLKQQAEILERLAWIELKISDTLLNS